jgi:AcrR family transcriptional regulator
MIADGLTPTVEDAAAQAAISRTTAYRYFPNQRELLVAAHPEIEIDTLLDGAPADDVARRVDIVVDQFLRITVENEPALRTMLRLSLELEDAERSTLLLRQGRAITWLKEALEPLRGRLTDGEIEWLAVAIRSCAGIESLVWLRDVARLDTDDAIELMKWSAHSVLQAGLRDAGISL